MKLIPFSVGALQFNVFVILEEENLERMNKFDPAQVGMDRLGEPWTSLTLKTIIIGTCPKDDMAHVDKLVREGRGAQALEFLSRGFQYRTDLGDSDKPYKPADSGGLTS